MVRVWRKHNQFITDVHMQRGGVRELVSGCRDGEVKLWDLRWKDEVRTIRAVDTAGTGAAAAARGAALRGLTVHEHAPVFAAGTSTHSLNLFNMNGTPLNVLNPTIPSWVKEVMGQDERAVMFCHSCLSYVRMKIRITGFVGWWKGIFRV